MEQLASSGKREDLSRRACEAHGAEGLGEAHAERHDVQGLRPALFAIVGLLSLWDPTGTAALSEHTADICDSEHEIALRRIESHKSYIDPVVSEAPLLAKLRECFSSMVGLSYLILGSRRPPSLSFVGKFTKALVGELERGDLVLHFKKDNHGHNHNHGALLVKKQSRGSWQIRPVHVREGGRSGVLRAWKVGGQRIPNLQPIATGEPCIRRMLPVPLLRCMARLSDAEATLLALTCPLTMYG